MVLVIAERGWKGGQSRAEGGHGDMGVGGGAGCLCYPSIKLVGSRCSDRVGGCGAPRLVSQHFHACFRHFSSARNRFRRGARRYVWFSGRALACQSDRVRSAMDGIVSAPLHHCRLCLSHRTCHHPYPESAPRAGRIGERYGRCSMTKGEVRQRLTSIGVVPVIRASSAQKALMAGDALYKGGIGVLEITLTVPGAEKAIESLAKNFVGDGRDGVGTGVDMGAADPCPRPRAQSTAWP